MVVIGVAVGTKTCNCKLWCFIYLSDFKLHICHRQTCAAHRWFRNQAAWADTSRRAVRPRPSHPCSWAATNSWATAYAGERASATRPRSAAACIGAQLNSKLFFNLNRKCYWRNKSNCSIRSIPCYDLKCLKVCLFQGIDNFAQPESTTVLLGTPVAENSSACIVHQSSLLQHLTCSIMSASGWATASVFRWSSIDRVLCFICDNCRISYTGQVIKVCKKRKQWLG